MTEEIPMFYSYGLYTGQKQKLPPMVEAHFAFMRGILREDPKQAIRFLVVMKTVQEFIESGIGDWVNPQYNSDIIIDPKTSKQYGYKDLSHWSHVGFDELNEFVDR